MLSGRHISVAHAGRLTGRVLILTQKGGSSRVERPLKRCPLWPSHASARKSIHSRALSDGLGVHSPHFLSPHGGCVTVAVLNI